MELKIITPFRQRVTRKTMKDKLYTININQYRNWHHSVESKVKKQFTIDLEDQLKGVVFDGVVDITYQVFKPTNRRLDKMNVVSITSKYTLDAITHYECWEDDNDEVIRFETILPTQLDRENPRVEVTIKTLS